MSTNTSRISYLFLSSLVLLLVLIVSLHPRVSSSSTDDYRLMTSDCIVSKVSSFYPIKFYSRDDFVRSVAYAEKQTKDESIVIAGVVPHHLFVSQYIAHFFSQRAFNPPKTVILLGPNHENAGQSSIMSTNLPWQTEFGMLLPDEERIERLRAMGVLSIEQDPFLNEHAIGGLVPYIKYYYPEASILPLLFKSTASKAEIQQFAKAISDRATDDDLIVSSVDFSHYLTASVAAKNDETTLDVMQRYDHSALLALDNQDFLDSPASISALLQIMEREGILHFDVLYHTNSGFLQNTLHTPTTSYFVLNFFGS